MISDAYLAGVIDADGSIGLHKSGRGYYKPVISVTMREKWFLEKLQSYMRNTLTVRANLREKKRYNNRAANCFELYVCGQYDCHRLLNSIGDDLIVKRDQAAYLLEYLSHSKNAGDYYYSILKQLNSRGINREVKNYGYKEKSV